MKVLVVGLRGLGVDVVRNLMCHGVNAIAILDDDCLREDDIASSTFFDISDVGRKKSVVVKARLAHLNAATRLSTLSGILTSDLLLNYHVRCSSSLILTVLVDV
ncbi:E1 ubiquitin-activating protein [Aphanomyces cochlioides]|nr:E1 ubiquitin-activating protein [Aphanomyces cochlioides]